MSTKYTKLLIAAEPSSSSLLLTLVKISWAEWWYSKYFWESVFKLERTLPVDLKSLISAPLLATEKLLVKNAEEYTSPIIKIYRLESVFIICTENSIYVTSSDIDKRRISQ